MIDRPADEDVKEDRIIEGTFPDQHLPPILNAQVTEVGG